MKKIIIELYKRIINGFLMWFN